MKTFLFTSDKYVDIVADQAKLFNKFCATPQRVTVLGFQKPTVEYPPNYEFASMGNQDDFPPRCWSEPIRPFIESVEDDYFVMWWDDLFPICELDEELFAEAIELVKNKKAEKVHFFWGSDKQYENCSKFNDNFRELSQTAEYRSALVPGVWSKEYFLRNLHSNFSPWDYEVRNQADTTYDGATILISNFKPIIGWVNMFRQGRFNQGMWDNYEQSKTGHFAWNKFQVLTDEVAQIVGSYKGKVL